MLDQDNEGGTFGGLEITRRRILFTSGGLNLSTSPVRNLRETRTIGRMANFTFLRGWAKIANWKPCFRLTRECTASAYSSTSQRISATGPSKNIRVTSRKVGTVSFVSIADEGRSCGTKTPERARNESAKKSGVGVSQ